MFVSVCVGLLRSNPIQYTQRIKETRKLNCYCGVANSSKNGNYSIAGETESESERDEQYFELKSNLRSGFTNNAVNKQTNTRKCNCDSQFGEWITHTHKIISFCLCIVKNRYNRQHKLQNAPFMCDLWQNTHNQTANVFIYWACFIIIM